jgi:hypothetical protein
MLLYAYTVHFGGSYGYESHQFPRRNQVVKRSICSLKWKGIKDRGREFTVAGISFKSHLFESGNCGIQGAARWKNKRCVKVGCWFGAGTSQKEVSDGSGEDWRSSRALEWRDASRA